MRWPIKVPSLHDIHLRPRARIERLRHHGCGEHRALRFGVGRERHGAFAGGCVGRSEWCLFIYSSMYASRGWSAIVRNSKALRSLRNQGWRGGDVAISITICRHECAKQIYRHFVRPRVSVPLSTHFLCFHGPGLVLFIQSRLRNMRQRYKKIKDTQN